MDTRTDAALSADPSQQHEAEAGHNDDDECQQIMLQRQQIELEREHQRQANLEHRLKEQLQLAGNGGTPSFLLSPASQPTIASPPPLLAPAIDERYQHVGYDDESAGDGSGRDIQQEEDVTEENVGNASFALSAASGSLHQSSEKPAGVVKQVKGVVRQAANFARGKFRSSLNEKVFLTTAGGGSTLSSNIIGHANKVPN